MNFDHPGTKALKQGFGREILTSLCNQSKRTWLMLRGSFSGEWARTQADNGWDCWGELVRAQSVPFTEVGLCLKRDDLQRKEGKIPWDTLNYSRVGKIHGSIMADVYVSRVLLMIESFKVYLQCQNVSIWGTFTGRLLSVHAFSKQLGTNFTWGQLCDIQGTSTSTSQTNKNGQGGSLGCIPRKDAK